jgi:hypothetical protein
MKRMEVIETTDGKLFVDEDKARRHQIDLVGEEMDQLFRDMGMDRPAHRAALKALDLLIQGKATDTLRRLLRHIEGLELAECE